MSGTADCFLRKGLTVHKQEMDATNSFLAWFWFWDVFLPEMPPKGVVSGNMSIEAYASN